MARQKRSSKTGFRQQYSANGINASTAGHSGATTQGRFKGGRQGFSVEQGGAKSHDGKYISRRKKYYQVRVGLGLSGG